MNEKEYLEWFDSKDLGFEMFTKAGNRKCGYREILDSEPPYHIKHYIMRACKIAGYDHDFDRFDLSSACYR